MPRYEEYCPRGKTKRTVKFELEGRKPEPSRVCICGSRFKSSIYKLACLASVHYPLSPETGRTLRKAAINALSSANLDHFHSSAIREIPGRNRKRINNRKNERENR